MYKSKENTQEVMTNKLISDFPNLLQSIYLRTSKINRI